MWTTDESRIGLAVWRDDHAAWSLDARGGTRGIGVLPVDVLAAAGALESVQRWFQIQAVEQESIPAIGEQFVRGEELHLHYPQADGCYGLRLAVRPVHCTSEHLVLEITVAIETNLLDTHPMVDVIVPGAATRFLDMSDFERTTGAAPISVNQAETTMAVFLGPHDAPFTSDLSSGQELKLRLFGDFLEKGVIRKSRPWIVVDRGGEIGDPQLRRFWRELAQSPLPLTP